MADLAELGLRIESQEAELADRRLDSFERSAQRAENATDSLAAAARGLGSSLLPTLTSIDASVREMLELQRVQQGVVGASAQQVAATQAVARETVEATAAVSFYSASFRTTQATMGGAAAAAKDWGTAVSQADSHVRAYRQHLEQLNATLGQQDAHMGAYRQHMASLAPVIGQADAHMAAYRNQIGRVGTGLKLTAQDGLNFSRQMADIGVTAAMGMNPLMIALQQGPQLFDIMQQTAIRSGMTIRATMAATGAVIWAALAPLLPIMAAIAAAAAVAFGAAALATRGAREEIGDLTKGMGLSEEQLKRLKDEGVSTGVTMGDVFRGTGTTIKEVFFGMFKDQIDWLGKRWTEFMDATSRIAMAAVKGIAGGFLGALYTIRDTWKMLPAALGDAAFSAANFVIRGVEAMINGGVRLLNGLIDKANAAANAIPGLNAFIPRLEEARLAQISNQYAGAMTALGVQAGQSFSRGMADGSAGVDRAAARLAENIRASGQARIRAAAGDADGAGASGSGRGGIAKLKEDLDQLARITLRPIDIRLPRVDEVLPLRLIADELRLIDQLARDAAHGMTSAFGETGRAMGDLLTVMTGYESRTAEIALAVREKRLTEAQGVREQAAAQVQSYGDMLGAAKLFFEEGSGGYRALQAAEAAYRVFQFAMSVQAMALGAAETSAHVAQSGTKAAASTAEGAAKMFAQLGPYAFPVVAAMIALLAGLGMKGKGGGGGGSSPSVDASVSTSQGYGQQADAAQSSFAASVAQKVEVKVTADRDGLNAYVAETAGEVARPMVMQGMAAASGATRAQVMSDLDKGRTYSRRPG